MQGQQAPGNRTASTQDSVCRPRARKHTEGRAEGGGQAGSHGARGRGRKCGFHGRILSGASSLNSLTWAAWPTADCCLEGKAGRVARRTQDLQDGPALDWGGGHPSTATMEMGNGGAGAGGSSLCRVLSLSTALPTSNETPNRRDQSTAPPLPLSQRSPCSAHLRGCLSPQLDTSPRGRGLQSRLHVHSHSRAHRLWNQTAQLQSRPCHFLTVWPGAGE